MKSKDAIQTVSIVLSFVGGALLVYALIQLFVFPVQFKMELFGDYVIVRCGDYGGVLNALGSDSYECVEEAWKRINSSIIWVCLGPAMLFAGLKVRRDVLDKAE